MTLLLLQMFPSLMSAAAFYIVLSDIHGLDNLWWYIAILCGGSAYNIWLMKGYMDTVPRDLDEAAVVDGASNFRIFWQVILPLTLPMIVVIFIFSFIGNFTEYPLANLLLTSPDHYTVGLGLYWLLNPASHAQNFTQFSAAALIIAVPITVVYMIFQKWIVSGLTAGAVKG
jgi:arabinogalactan oligomer/maltooligosaccharide transport system permease protein